MASLSNNNFYSCLFPLVICHCVQAQENVKKNKEISSFIRATIKTIQETFISKKKLKQDKKESENGGKIATMLLECLQTFKWGTLLILFQREFFDLLKVLINFLPSDEF